MEQSQVLETEKPTQVEFLSKLILRETHLNGSECLYQYFFYFFSDTFDAVNDKAGDAADVVKQSFEKTKTFAGEVLNSTANLASKKVEEGKEFAKSVHQKVNQIVSDKATLAGDVKDKVVAKSQAGAEALGEFATGIFVLQSY